MTEKKTAVLSDETLDQVSGGVVDASKYTEEELARIFDLYIDMYKIPGCLPYLEDFGVTSGDLYLILRKQYWDETPYYDATPGYKLAHLVYKRSH